MAYTQSELIDRVSAKIDEVLPPVQGVEGEGMFEAPVNFITEVIDKAAENILLKAPKAMIRQVVKKGSLHFPVGATDPDTPPINPNIRLIYTAETGISVIVCPVDYLRFFSIQLTDWKTPVTELIEEGDPKYRIQKNNRVRRGTPTKPYAALISFADYEANEQAAGWYNKGAAIECFSNPTQPTLTAFYYIPQLKAVDIPPSLIDAVIWDAASQTLDMMAQYDKAKVALENSERYFRNLYGLQGEGKMAG
ncbi:MAG: hypothetical protein CL554_08090 [Algoriphagus sp.]|jgi:hypothetical protein|uniref:hypothetical protein n=1 Tax=Algoriphagus sp. TaxID=1872435 RepID=UPI000C5E5809|nr:hypothetical protein [Algoriphagus sp.]MAL13376.1 hypothetical protein [Algoriphagus sp.]MAN85556.1 hypothetical protein [Algoriphagus sp.]HAS58509.1 hypothetical protein [Algoriphagus sp.]HCX77509.1 hypothetical protein [Algoriphagus sp.]|tara:strand:+ start:9060 stop:9809 length:750 start_codon:yes stop_codon:yes gene_type:complete